MSLVGEIVQVRGEAWVVTRADAFDRCTVLTLEGHGGDNVGHRLRLIEPFDRPVVVSSQRWRRRRRKSVLRAALSAIVAARPVNGLWAAAGAKLTLLPYQLEPALAVIDGATRVLLADAVGLGKTVQAGLILAELQARGLVDRALVLTPAGLRNTWAAELASRFGLEPAVLDQTAITGRSWSLPVGANPWTSHAIVIASIDFVKRPEVLAAVEDSPFDLLIADEAHHLTPGSDRGVVVERLSRRTPWVVLASATPHSGDEAAFAYLTRLGALGDCLTVFRRSRQDVGFTHSRHVRLLAVRPTTQEVAMLSAVERYARAIWRARGTTDPAVRLVATTLGRRAASSAPALERTLVRRLSLLSGVARPQPHQPMLPWEESDDADGDEPDVVVGRQGLEDPTEECRQLESIVTLARQAQGASSKISRILRLIDRAREPAVVFTEYRDTLEALAAAFGVDRPVATIHGGFPAPRRQDAIDRFTKGGVDLLIATDTAGEGLSLHHRCRLVINVELPWNPLRLEQRIGRVDRLGQARRVHAVHLFHRGSIEDTVLARLERRRMRAALAMSGPAREWSNERDIAAAAWGEDGIALSRPPAITTSAVPRAISEVHRLEAQRRRRAFRLSAIHRPVCAWPPPNAHASRRLVLLYETQHLDPQGRLLEQRTVAVAVASARALSFLEWRPLVDWLGRDKGVQVVLADEGARRDPEVDRALRPFRVALVSRLQSIRAGLAPLHPSRLQPSLFDRRAERSEHTRHEVLARLDAHFSGRLGVLTHWAPSREGFRARLLAAWPLRDGP